jgi:hypothetical protein
VFVLEKHFKVVFIIILMYRDDISRYIQHYIYVCPGRMFKNIFNMLFMFIPGEHFKYISNTLVMLFYRENISRICSTLPGTFHKHIQHARYWECNKASEATIIHHARRGLHLDLY